MKATVCNEFVNDSMDMRTAYCNSLIALAEKDERIVALDADLMSAMGMKPFGERFPDRMLDCGVQEANMVGVACGMSAAGKIPFAHSFGPFISRRACDQVFMSGAYAKMNVKLIGSDPGITAQLNGGTHMPFEDMGIMRGIPTMTVVEPTDVAMLQSLLPQIAACYGMTYMRLVRRSVTKVYEAGAQFELGKGFVAKSGCDATVVASGFCVAEALKAAYALECEGIHVRVIDMFTWKPLDEELLLAAARETGAIVTAENHSVIHGLGAAVASALVRNYPVPVEMVGVQDVFGEVGYLPYLAERFGLSAKYIAEAIRKVLARKKRGGKMKYESF